MNICIYRTMRNQWYHDQSSSPQAATTSSQRQSSSRRIIHFMSSRQSSTSTDIMTHSVIRRVGGLNEAAYKKRDAKYTRASVVMVVAFVVCNTPRFVPNIMEIFISLDEFPSWGYVLISVNHMLTVFNSAFNFLIYWSFCCGGRKRRTLNSSPPRLGRRCANNTTTTGIII